VNSAPGKFPGKRGGSIDTLTKSFLTRTPRHAIYHYLTLFLATRNFFSDVEDQTMLQPQSILRIILQIRHLRVPEQQVLWYHCWEMPA